MAGVCGDRLDLFLVKMGAVKELWRYARLEKEVCVPGWPPAPQHALTAPTPLGQALTVTVLDSVATDDVLSPWFLLHERYALAMSLLCSAVEHMCQDAYVPALELLAE